MASIKDVYGLSKPFLQAMDVFKDVFFYSQQIVSEELTHEFSHLSQEQLAVLILIDLSGPLTSTEIATFQGTHKSAVSNRLKKLQMKQLIEFQEDQQDNRVKYVCLSEAGKQKMNAYNDEILAYFEGLFSDLDVNEINQFNLLLSKVRDRLKQHSPLIRVNETKHRE
ncbi:transcriptional regulator, MarR family [Bacillus sp. JCM 19046]|uniref:DNA-binding MarR family transcriptional regulator n=1 Tax=Shouchella xiaoxiensis TaxID=766895 RepID=A0ABS2SXX4_9BACI|nr:MarR family transcriptional regulator [Shouchella xiaoxiensis]MBM7840381.1 DNA-binding MarR family transcriptional regulator [Shouchella xiaoxiensis]GAF19431.1 transcriptional regulator, MarR family [Bacillus sp. JCM 19046]